MSSQNIEGVPLSPPNLKEQRGATLLILLTALGFIFPPDSEANSVSMAALRLLSQGDSNHLVEDFKHGPAQSHTAQFMHSQLGLENQSVLFSLQPSPAVESDNQSRKLIKSEQAPPPPENLGQELTAQILAQLSAWLAKLDLPALEQLQTLLAQHMDRRLGVALPTPPDIVQACQKAGQDPQTTPPPGCPVLNLLNR
jgi:hypothetical protein